VIDLHTHLLPGVDDGSPTLQHSAMVLGRFGADGVRGVACTPHLAASDCANAPVAAHAALRAELQALAPDGLTLYGGWEIMLDAPGALQRLPGMSLGSSRTVLVEWPRATVPPWGTAELGRLRGNGHVPLVAHVERYHGVTLDIVRAWRSLGAAIQTDATMLVAGGDKCEFAKSMLTEGLVDVLASDNHGDRRTLAMARWWLGEIGAGDQAVLLTETNPSRLLRDEAVLPVPGIVFDQDMFQRLRAWWQARRTAEVPNSESHD
jgi:protein-tyrosine phosphatase